MHRNTWAFMSLAKVWCFICRFFSFEIKFIYSEMHKSSLYCSVFEQMCIPRQLNPPENRVSAPLKDVAWTPSQWKFCPCRHAARCWPGVWAPCGPARLMHRIYHQTGLVAVTVALKIWYLITAMTKPGEFFFSIPVRQIICDPFSLSKVQVPDCAKSRVFSRNQVVVLAQAIICFAQRDCRGWFTVIIQRNYMQKYILCFWSLKDIYQRKCVLQCQT